MLRSAPNGGGQGSPEGAMRIQRILESVELLRQRLMVVLLSAVLFILGGQMTSCVVNPVPAIYGPAPIPKDADGGPSVLYGPQPVDAGPVDTGPVDTGPIDTGPVDTGATDAGPTDIGPADVNDTADSSPAIFYGPVRVDSGPTDAATDTVDVKDAGISTLYGPLPVDSGPSEQDTSKADCVPPPIYGPKPCQSDVECVDENSEGWYCDKNNTFDDGCGGKITWPVCKSP